MYATEKYVKLEAKELRESINNLASDLGGEIKDLYKTNLELKELINTLQMQIEYLKRESNEF